MLLLTPLSCRQLYPRLRSVIILSWISLQPSLYPHLMGQTKITLAGLFTHILQIQICLLPLMLSLMMLFSDQLNILLSGTPLSSLLKLRKMPVVNDAVTQLLSDYEQGNGQELIQAKPESKRSDRYNNTDASALQPQFRWPNESYTGGISKKMIGFDDFLIPKWVAGLLINAIQIQDDDILRSVFTQTIFRLRDVWPEFTEAYASS